MTKFAEASAGPVRHDVELAVIGAGPAGVAAALAAADEGLRVALIDGAAEPGGQYYRQPAPELHARHPERLFHDWSTWKALRARLDVHQAAGSILPLMNRQVWTAEKSPDTRRRFTIHTTVNGVRASSPRGDGVSQTNVITAAGLVLATGGYEYVLPFPGWTLPGVVTAGGAQAMLKSGLVLPPGRRVVVAGSGPLLMPVAATLADAGADVVGLFEATSLRQIASQGQALAGSRDKLREGMGYAARMVRGRVPVRFRHVVVGAHGDGRLSSVTVARLDPSGQRVVPGSERRIACDALAVSHGMRPHTELAHVLGALDDEQRARLDLDGGRAAGRGVEVDDEQRTSVEFLWAAGETTGIGGAALAIAEGEIAGRSAAARLRGGVPDPGAWREAHRVRLRLRAFASCLDRMYAQPGCWPELITDDTLVCRCEEVPAAAVREAVRDFGAGDLRSVKLLTRAGMGWCQGRMCSVGVAGVAGCDVDALRNPFARPVQLGVLALGDEPRSAGAADHDEGT